MTETLLSAVRDAMTLLVKLREERVGPEVARASLQALKALHPDPWMDLVWEQEAYEGTLH